MARILINTVSLSGGALTRERHVLRSLAELDTPHEYHVLWTQATRDKVGDLPDDMKESVVQEPSSAPRRLLWENTGLVRRIRDIDPDLLYFPLHINGLWEHVPKVSAIRNVAPFYPEAHQGAGLRERIRLRVLRAATRHTIRTSERVLFMSEATRDRVAEVIPGAAEKGVVVPHGIPAEFDGCGPDPEVRNRYDVPAEYLLGVSNIVRYKNIVELVEGYARASSELPPLYMAGAVHDETYVESVRAAIRQHGLEEDVHLLGEVAHEDLPALYAECTAFVFSSACENAPITLLEALACGAPIASSDRASMPEICGDAAVYFDPYDPADIGATLRGLVTDADERESLSRSARSRAAEFSWDRAGEQTSAVFSEVAV